MKKSQKENYIKNLIANISSDNVNSEDIDVESSLTNDYGLDSFDLAEMTVKIEDEYGVDVFEDNPVDSISEILEKIKE
jgi:acyl carrier protein